MQSTTWDENILKLQQAYVVINELVSKLGLVLEHDKMEIFHFSRKHNNDNPAVTNGDGVTSGNGDEVTDNNKLVTQDDD